MRRKTTRLDLVRKYKEPSSQLRFEFWADGQVLVHGLPTAKDYLAFPSMSFAIEFICLNYDIEK